jgi:hypothetical protein
MNLPKARVSEAIAAVMGIDVNRGWWCEKCQSFIDGRQVTYQENHDNCGYPVIYLQFSAFTPDGIWQWKSYMEKEMPGTWNRYGIYAGDEVIEMQGINVVKAYMFMFSTANFIQYLYDNLDGWGYEKCWHTGFVDREQCQNCNGTGKVLTERAKKFKTIVEMSQKEEVR